MRLDVKQEILDILSQVYTQLDVKQNGDVPFGVLVVNIACMSDQLSNLDKNEGGGAAIWNTSDEAFLEAAKSLLIELHTLKDSRTE